MLRTLSKTAFRGALVPHHSRMDCIDEELDMPQTTTHTVQAFSQGCGMKVAGTLG